MTGQPYVRHDGGGDAVIAGCASDDPQSGGDKLPKDEPAVATKPDEPSFLAAGANDSCPSALTVVTLNWFGVCVSSDGGGSWTDSLLPGYRGDMSVAGQASPLFGVDNRFSDPVLASDNAGTLFVGSIALNGSLAKGNAVLNQLANSGA